MATAEYKATVGTVAPSASSANLVGATLSAMTAAASDGTEGAAVEDAVAVLEADDASPTQAHVNDLRAAWDAYVAKVDAASTAAAAITADISLYIGTVANVADMNKLKSALRALELCIQGSNLLAQGSANPRPF